MLFHLFEIYRQFIRRPVEAAEETFRSTTAGRELQ